MPVESSPFTFLQVSDVHLDSKLASRRLALPHAKKLERNQEILNALVKALDAARQRRVDAVLMPGDIWDSESVTSRTMNKLLEAFKELGDIQVVIAPGNHDYCSDSSFYNPQVLAARGIRPWPDNVFIFRSPDFSIFRHPQRPDVSFTGRAFTANSPVTERLLAGPVPRDVQADINVLLFHGSLDGYKGGDAGWPGKITAPFSAQELSQLGFSYAAVGHYHEMTEIRVDGGPLLGAYSGCLVGRSFEESGPRYALFGSIARREDGTAECSLEPVEMDCRRLLVVSCDITGMTSTEVMREVKSALEKQGARPGIDIVCVKPEGRHPTGGEPTYMIENLRGIYYHLVVEDETRPDYLTQRFDKRTTEGKFIQALLELKKRAEAAGGTLSDTEYGSDLTVEIIEDALYYGLEALKEKRVTVRNVD
jgi:DNA repair exonuclease SbcCD nuclease subunit